MSWENSEHTTVSWYLGALVDESTEEAECYCGGGSGEKTVTLEPPGHSLPGFVDAEGPKMSSSWAYHPYLKPHYTIEDSIDFITLADKSSVVTAELGP